MADRADAHIHLFEGGYQGPSFVKRLGMKIDEAVCYASLAKDYGVKAALIVGYSDAPWCANNHHYLARMAEQYDWVRPATYVDAAKPPDVEDLERFRAQGIVGVSLYISGPERVAALLAISDEVWAWIAEHRWLVSVNSKGEDWSAWQNVLERHGGLRLVISHLGLPPQVGEPPAGAEAREAMGTVLALAAFPEVRVKLSGFYALTDPKYDYPHRAVWPYVEALAEKFGVGRLLWASDFTPSLDSLSFPQTFGLFSHMPFLSDADRERIEGANLLELLDAVD